MDTISFPSIFLQNETGDPKYQLKEVDLMLWGPHVLLPEGGMPKHI